MHCKRFPFEALTIFNCKGGTWGIATLKTRNLLAEISHVKELAPATTPTRCMTRTLLRINVASLLVSLELEMLEPPRSHSSGCCNLGQISIH